MIRSVKRYCRVVEEEVKITQVEDVATAIAGSTPMHRKKGEKINPPPIPTRPAKHPVNTPINSYLATSRGDQLSFTTQARLLKAMTTRHTVIGTASVSSMAQPAPEGSPIKPSSRLPTRNVSMGWRHAASRLAALLPCCSSQRQALAWCRTTPLTTTTASMPAPKYLSTGWGPQSLRSFSLSSAGPAPCSAASASPDAPGAASVRAPVPLASSAARSASPAAERSAATPAAVARS
mmetsp:Transcript_107856/g.300741  ORF Transcript_107856/g.300741 Transcript_107856/m.300741 type:complete len:235 (+) Transcript_107856:301-1005(+)